MFIGDIFNKKQLNESLRDGEYYTFRVFFDDGSDETLNFSSDDIDWDRVGAKRGKKVVNAKRLGGIQGSQYDTPGKPHQYSDDSFARAQRAYDKQLPESVANVPWNTVVEAILYDQFDTLMDRYGLTFDDIEHIVRQHGFSSTDEVKAEYGQELEEAYDTSEHNREYFDNVQDWAHAVQDFGADVIKARGVYVAHGWEGEAGEFDPATGEGWLVSKVARMNESPASSPALKKLILRHIGEVKQFAATGELDPTGNLFYELYEYFANEIPASVRQNPHKLERVLINKVAPILKHYATTTMNENKVEKMNEADSHAQVHLTGQRFHAQVARIMQDLVQEYQDEARASTTTPSAPDTTKFRAHRGGMIEYAHNLTVQGGYYAGSKTYIDFIKVGGGLNPQVFKDLVTDFRADMLDVFGVDVKPGLHIKTTDGYTFFFPSFETGSNWGGFGFLHPGAPKKQGVDEGASWEKEGSWSKKMKQQQKRAEDQKKKEQEKKQGVAEGVANVPWNAVVEAIVYDQFDTLMDRYGLTFDDIEHIVRQHGFNSTDDVKAEFGQDLAETHRPVPKAPEPKSMLEKIARMEVLGYEPEQMSAKLGVSTGEVVAMLRHLHRDPDAGLETFDDIDNMYEAGPFSYGAKKPRKGSVADLAAKKRKEQERNKQPVEPKDQMVGVARVTKDVAEGSVQDKLHKRHQELRKKSGLPDPNYYKELKATYDLPDEERYAKAAELKKKYKVAEARKAEQNFDIEDIKNLESIRDLATLKLQAFNLISRPSAKPMKPEKVEWLKQRLEDLKSPMAVIKLMYDLLLSGEGHAVIGSRHSMNPNSYRGRFGESTITNEDIEKYVEELERAGYAIVQEEKVRLDKKCWKGKKIGNPKTKMKGGVRVNNCVPAKKG